MGIDHSAEAAGTAGLGTQWPWENAFDSKISARLVARESARRTRTSLNGGLSILKPMSPLVNHAYSGPKSTLPASQAARRDDGSGSMLASTPSAYGSPGTK